MVRTVCDSKVAFPTNLSKKMALVSMGNSEAEIWVLDIDPTVIQTVIVALRTKCSDFL